MKRKWIALLAINLAALLGLLLTFTGLTGGVAGAVMGVLLVLILPGYVAVAALVGRQVGMVERIALSVALSVALIIAGGFLLNALPGGLQPRSWSVYILLIILVGSCVVVARSRGDAAPPLGAIRIPRPAPRDLALALVAIALLAGASVIALQSAQSRRDGGFTQLWMLPGPVTAKGDIITLGVRSQELTTQTYQLSIQVDGAVAQTYRVTLRPGQEWSQNVTIALNGVPGPITVTGELYRLPGDHSPYRHVHVTLAPVIITPTG